MLNVVNKSMMSNQLLDMIYMTDNGSVTKRRIKVYKVENNSFYAYCFLRGSRRTFKVDNILALVPVVRKERMVI